MNFRTLTQPDPAVSRLSCSIVHELSDEYARQPGRLKQSKAGSPKGAGRCGAGCQRKSEDAGGGTSRPQRGWNDPPPQVDRNTARPAPDGAGRCGAGCLRESEGAPGGAGRPEGGGHWPCGHARRVRDEMPARGGRSVGPESWPTIEGQPGRQLRPQRRPRKQR